MTAYRDTYGQRIQVGDIVAHAVTINRERYAEGFTVNVCRKVKGRLIIDGASVLGVPGRP